MKTAIIGAGAAGCFCATHLRRLCPEMQIDVYESKQAPLQKVAITGGGRCNLTNSFAEVRSLKQVYPRGYNLMKRLLKRFDHRATMQWFVDEGVKLVVQEDQCVFPQSQDAMQIVRVLLKGIEGTRVLCGQRVREILPVHKQPEQGTKPTEDGKNAFEAGRPRYRVSTDSRSEVYDYVVVTTGGSPKASGLDFLTHLGLKIEAPVPSLFTFNIGETNSSTPITKLMGVVVEHVEARLSGTNYRTDGPLLITHWGMSGPAILKLSSLAARWLAERDYRATLCINWMGGLQEGKVREQLQHLLDEQPKKQIGSVHPLTQRLWSYLLNKLEIASERRCSEIGSKQLNRLVATLCSDSYPIAGQSRNKDEFVTCGGVALTNIDLNTLACKEHPGVYLAGEVLDVDAVTGGFNLQAAWTMGYTVARSIAEEIGSKPMMD